MSERTCLYDLIKESFLLLDFGDRRFFDERGLTVSRYYALHHIAAEPGVAPSRLSQLMFCDKSNITRLLQGLEADDLIERQRHEHDGRAQRLYLTAEGARLHGEVAVAHLGLIERRLAVLATPDVARTTGVLAQLNQSLAQNQTEDI